VSEIHRARQNNRYLRDLASLVDHASFFGGRTWWILVDSLDESLERIHNEHNISDSGLAVVLPLIKDTKLLLQTPALTYKLFLKSGLREPLQDHDVRWDRIPNWTLEWAEFELRTMIDNRLRTFSHDKVPNLFALCDNEETGEWLSSTVVSLAKGSPRAVNAVLAAVLGEHVKDVGNPDITRLTFRSCQRGLREVCARLASVNFRFIKPSVFHLDISSLACLSPTSNS